MGVHYSEWVGAYAQPPPARRGNACHAVPYGTLIFKGKRYPLTVSGIGLGSVGVNDYTAAGTVTGLQRPQDINGIFTRVGTGLTLGGGASIAEMRNDSGVTIQLDSTTEGLSVSLGAAGMKIAIAK